MPMQKFLTIFDVHGSAGKLNLNKLIAAPTLNLASKRMSRLISEHSGYKVGTPIEVTGEQYDEHPFDSCGDVCCCESYVLHPDKVDIWIGTDRQIYDTGRTMQAKYDKVQAQISERQDEERISLESQLANPDLNEVEQEAILADIQKVYA